MPDVSTIIYLMIDLERRSGDFAELERDRDRVRKRERERVKKRDNYTFFYFPFGFFATVSFRD